jgi:HJR/Mrr/RecB family endonuclease
MEYIGEVIPQTEFIRRTREYDAEGFKHYYFMTLKNDEVKYIYIIENHRKNSPVYKYRLLMLRKEVAWQDL